MGRIFRDDVASQKYQVVIPNPTFGQTFSNIPAKSWLTSGVITGAVMGGGYVVGKHWRYPVLVMAGLVQIGGSFTAMMMSSFGRLKGYLPNDQELKEHRIPKKELVEIIRKRKVIDPKDISQPTNTYHDK